MPYLEGLAPSPRGSCYKDPDSDTEDPNSDTSCSPGSTTDDTSRSSSVVSWGLETRGQTLSPARASQLGTGRSGLSQAGPRSVGGRGREESPGPGAQVSHRQPRLPNLSGHSGLDVGRHVPSKPGAAPGPCPGHSC